MTTPDSIHKPSGIVLATSKETFKRERYVWAITLLLRPKGSSVSVVVPETSYSSLYSTWQAFPFGTPTSIWQAIRHGTITVEAAVDQAFACVNSFEDTIKRAKQQAAGHVEVEEAVK